MDETTRVIIAAVSGFIVAFFAEPLKLNFQNNSRKKYLRIALYSEIHNNYRFLSAHLKIYHENNPQQIKAFFDGTMRLAVRTDCYKHFTSHYPDLLYQLKEASIINLLYAYLISAINPMLSSENKIHDFRSAIESFVALVEEYVYTNQLRRDVMEKVSSKAELMQLIEKYKKTYPDSFSQ